MVVVIGRLRSAKQTIPPEPIRRLLRAGSPREFLGDQDSTGNSVFLKRLPPDAEQVLISRDQKIRFHFFAERKIMVVLGIS